MCDPITLAGIALSVGGVVANSVAAGEDARARDSVLAAERARQEGYDKEAADLNQQSQDLYKGFVPQQDVRATQIGDYLATKVAPDPNSTAASIMPSSSSDIVNQDLAKKQNEAQGYVDQQSTSLGKLRAFGDLLGDKTRMQGRDAGLIGQIGGFKTGSNAVMPIELNNAANAGNGARLLGDILSGVGNVAVGAGLNGGSAKLASLFTPKAPTLQGMY